MPFARKSSYKRKSYVKRKSSSSAKRPGRYAPKSNYIKTLVNRSVSKKIGGIVETKYIPIKPQRAVLPKPIWTTAVSTAPTYMWGGVLGNKPASWTTGLFSGVQQWTNLGGTQIPSGIDQGQHIGTSVFYKKSMLTFNINMLQQNDTVRPVQPYRFRVIAFKPKNRNRTVGDPSDPTKDLFLDVVGEEFGHGINTVQGMDLWQSLLNKKDYTVLKDSKFILSHPSYNNAAPAVPSVPGRGVACHQFTNSKDFSLSIPWDKKATLDRTTFLPENLNTTTGILILAQSCDPDEGSELFEMNWQGTTIYQDA